MDSDKEDSQKGGFFGNITKRIGKKHSNKSSPERQPVIIYGTFMSIPCRNVLALAKWIGLDVQLKEVDAFNKKEHKSEAYLKMNPAGTMPTLDDNGFHIWESRAILIYLLGKYGKDHHDLYPAEVQKRALIDNILYFDSSSLAPSLGDYFYPQIFAGRAPDADKEAIMKDRLAVFNTILGRQPYAAGQQISIADLSIVGVFSLFEICDYNIASYSHIEQWRDKVKKEIPFYKETTSQGIEAVKQFFQSHKK